MLADILRVIFKRTGPRRDTAEACAGEVQIAKSEAHSSLARLRIALDELGGHEYQHRGSNGAGGSGGRDRFHAPFKI